MIKAAKKELGKDSYLTRSKYFEETLAPMIRRWEANIDHAYLQEKSGMGNLNHIHEAAYKGDIRWLEAAIAIGAAIDYPVRPGVPPGPHPPTPKNCTALLLAMASAVVYRQYLLSAPEMYENVDPNELLSLAQGAFRCAVILVMQGADFERRLEMPSISGPVDRNSPYNRCQHAGIMGMSVKEMAAIIEDQELSEAIKLMEEDPVEHAWCRCGSRLRWTECHAAPAIPGQHSHCLFDNILDDGNQRMCYRVSPLAPCPCKVPYKTCFDCCGWETFQPQYQNDSTGTYVKMMSHATATTPQARAARMMKDAVATRPRNPISFVGTEEDYKAIQLRMLRLTGIRHLHIQLGPKTRIVDWNTTVYTGVMERLDNYFHWTDIHYMIEKAELLRPVEEWNNALEVYCDDMGLVGAERERIIRNHTASPFAPCANLACTNVETSVKQYSRCANCKSIAYCSRECQREDWQVHRRDCT